MLDTLIWLINKLLKPTYNEHNSKGVIEILRVNTITCIVDIYAPKNKIYYLNKDWLYYE